MPFSATSPRHFLCGLVESRFLRAHGAHESGSRKTQAVTAWLSYCEERETCGAFCKRRKHPPEQNPEADGNTSPLPPRREAPGAPTSPRKTYHSSSFVLFAYSHVRPLSEESKWLCHFSALKRSESVPTRYRLPASECAESSTTRVFAARHEDHHALACHAVLSSSGPLGWA